MKLLLVIVTIAAAAFATASDDLPSDSIYHLQAVLENQSRENSGLDRYRGHPVLVTMFYGSCPHVCPMLLSTIRLTEAQLSDDERADLRVLAISIDPERDTPEQLLEVSERHRLDTSRWSLARPEANTVRAIAGVLGVRYKRLPDGGFNHSTRILLLDRDGTITATSDKLGSFDEAFLNEIRKNLE